MPVPVRVGAVLVSAVLVAAVGSGPAAVASAGSAGTAAGSRPAVEDCGSGPALVRPASMILTCADDGELAEHLVWSSWTAASATAAGTVTWKDCVPNCAESRHWMRASADFTLADPVRQPGQRVLFTRLKLHVTGPTPAAFMRDVTFVETPVPSRPLPHRWGTHQLPPPAPSGTLGYTAIEGYWVYAGGPTGTMVVQGYGTYTDEQVAAAITGAESAFLPGNIQPGVDYCDPGSDRAGWGLWQITCGNEESQFGTDFQLLDPWNNAEAAVAVYDQGGWTRWTTYTAGTYKPFLQTSGPDENISDPGEYVQYHSTPPGTPSSPPPDPGSTYGPPMPNSYQIAFRANTGDLWYTTPANAGHRSTDLGLAIDTSPSIAASGEIAFQGSGSNHLWLRDPSTGANRDTGLGMAPGTSPSIVSLTGGGYEIAFQANTGVLWLNDPSTGKSVNTGLGMAEGSSPSIVATSGGSYAVAFQANTGDLWYYTPTNSGHRDLDLGMAPGTSPAITATASGSPEIAFQANTNDLWLYTPSNSGHRDLGLGMDAGTSPAITSLAGSYEIAFQSNANDLWLYTPGNAGHRDTDLGMAAASSPAITASSGGSPEVAFQANTNDLWYYTPSNAGHRDLDLGMAPDSNPAVPAP